MRTRTPITSATIAVPTLVHRNLALRDPFIPVNPFDHDTAFHFWNWNLSLPSMFQSTKLFCASASWPNDQLPDCLPAKCVSCHHQSSTFFTIKNEKDHSSPLFPILGFCREFPWVHDQSSLPKQKTLSTCSILLHFTLHDTSLLQQIFTPFHQT